MVGGWWLVVVVGGWVRGGGRGKSAGRESLAVRQHFSVSLSAHLGLGLVNLQRFLANEVRDLLLVDFNVRAPDEEGAVARAGNGLHDFIHSQGQHTGVGLCAQHGVRLPRSRLPVGKYSAIVPIHYRVHVALHRGLKQLPSG